MPVAVIKDVKAPIEAYEATCRVLGLEKGGPGPRGCMSLGGGDRERVPRDRCLR